MTRCTSGACSTSPARSRRRPPASAGRTTTGTRTSASLAHLLQTIGEAARRVSREYQKAHPEIPWGGIVGMRHKVVHDYMDVDEDVVWKTSVEEIPRLVVVLEPLAKE
jgi:uncharacterized protein with HEPN domain